MIFIFIARLKVHLISTQNGKSWLICDWHFSRGNKFNIRRLVVKKLSGIFRNELAYVLSSYLSTAGWSFIKIGEARCRTSRRGVNPIWNDPKAVAMNKCRSTSSRNYIGYQLVPYTKCFHQWFTHQTSLLPLPIFRIFRLFVCQHPRPILQLSFALYTYLKYIRLVGSFNTQLTFVL